MVTFTWTSNIDEVTRKFAALPNLVIGQAAVQALNLTAADVRKALRAEMATVFDRPTPWTLAAFFIQPATLENPVATILEKEHHARRDFLKVQAHGGGRRKTLIENLLRHATGLPIDVQAVIPVGGAKLDKYGNWSPGQRNQVLSGLGAQRDKHSNTTAQSKKRHKSRASFFIPKNGGLYPGIFSRPAGGGIPTMVALLSSAAPQYHPRFDFEGVARRTVQEKLPRYFADRVVSGYTKHFG